MDTTPGWYGKLPSTGDFASRRLPHVIIEPWDTWLAEELAKLKEQSDTWLSAYLESPTWRFVVPAKWVNPNQAGLLAGVLMPSVDSVGRYFPLSIMAALPEVPADAGALEQLMAWLHALDDLAADTLQEDWPIDTLEGALLRLPAPTGMSGLSAQASVLLPLLQGDVGMVTVPVPDTRQALMGQIGHMALQWLLNTHSALMPELGWWWCEPHAMVQQPQLLVSQGLPRDLDFSTLLGHNHTRHAPVQMQAPVVTAAPQPLPPGMLADPADATVPPQRSSLTAPAATIDDSDATLPPTPRAVAVASAALTDVSGAAEVEDTLPVPEVIEDMVDAPDQDATQAPQGPPSEGAEATDLAAADDAPEEPTSAEPAGEAPSAEAEPEADAEAAVPDPDMTLPNGNGAA